MPVCIFFLTLLLCVLAAFQEKALQKEVDGTLSEVRKKKHDANKAMELLRSLRKLRNLRKESAEKRGMSVVRTHSRNTEHDEKLSKNRESGL